MVQLTIFHHWFRWWLGAVQATSHCLNQWWLVYWRIYASLGLNELTHWDRVAYICVSKLDHHWFRWWLVAWSASSHYQTSVNRKWNSYIFIQEYAFQNFVCGMAAILSRPQGGNFIVDIPAVLWFIGTANQIYLVCLGDTSSPATANQTYLVRLWDTSSPATANQTYLVCLGDTSSPATANQTYLVCLGDTSSPATARLDSHTTRHDAFAAHLI